jgi:N-methylhydantoinase A
VRTVNVPLAALPDGLVQEVLAAQVAEGSALLGREGIELEHVEYLHEADMQFQGQSHLLTIPLAPPEVTADALRAGFEAAYWDRFQVRLDEVLPVLVNLRTAVIGRRRQMPLAALRPHAAGRSLEAARTGTRRVWFEPDGWQETPVYLRDLLPEDARIGGPAIVEQLDTTVVLEPGTRAACDRTGNLLIDVMS